MKDIPVIHCISNLVTANDCANILLAAGFSPMMADEPKEMNEIAKVADACVINLGTPSDRKYEAARIAGRMYNLLHKPVIIDPVGVSVSAYRRKNFLKLLENVQPDVIRCNLNEALAILENTDPGDSNVAANGIDSREDSKYGEYKAPMTAKRLAKRLNCVALVSGKIDAVSDGENVSLISGGSDLLKSITGAGCMLSALIGGYCTGRYRLGMKTEETEDTIEVNVKEFSMFNATLYAAEHYKDIAACAESYLSKKGGTGEMRMRLIDCTYRLRDRD